MPLAYAAWLSEATGETLAPARAAQQWEKAARGTDGRIFPWGDSWDPTRLNSADLGPFDTLPVGSFPDWRQPVWDARCGRPGVRMDRHRCWPGPL